MQHPPVGMAEVGVASRSDSNVLISGPTGSGKTRLAREIHQASSRALKPFVTVNLASLHDGTLESELFGHERGAFTSASERRVGRIELARGGTLFLDEVGEVPLQLQGRLLELLQSRTFSPVGSNRVSTLDVRIIAATNRDLAREVRAGRFREDLYHRLRVISIELTELAKRETQFWGIVRECIRELCASQKRNPVELSDDVNKLFIDYKWPGNVRELRNVLEYAVVAAQGSRIESVDLPRWFIAECASDGPPLSAEGAALGVLEMPLSLDFSRMMYDFEREYLRRALGRHRGRLNMTARSIGVNRSTLLRRLRIYGLEAARYEHDACLEMPG